MIRWTVSVPLRAETVAAYRERYASIRTPFGVRWSVMTRIEDLSNEESAAKVEAWLAQQS